MSDVPFMHEKEYKFIESHLNNQMTMLEWGSGGSTLYFSKFVKNYHSIEHDQEWYDKIKPQIDDNVIYHHIPSNVPWERPSDWRENPKHHNTPVKYFEEYKIVAYTARPCRMTAFRTTPKFPSPKISLRVIDSMGKIISSLIHVGKLNGTRYFPIG